MTILLVLETATPPTLPQVRCPSCRHRLFDGVLVGEIRCPKCGRLVKFRAPVA